MNFDWKDYNGFVEELEHYLEHHKRAFRFRDFFSKDNPNEEESKQFDSIFRMALTSLGADIASILDDIDGKGSVYIVTSGWKQNNK